MKKKIIALVMMLVVMVSNVIPVNAEGYSYEKYKKFKYEYFDETSISIRYYTGKKAKVTIPEKIKGTKVRHVNLIRAKNLKSIKISRYVKDVCLSRNEKLKKVTISKKNKYLSVKNNMVLNKKKTKLVSVLGGYEKIVIPTCVKTITTGSFYHSKVKRVIITKNVKKIESSVFDECGNLKDIVFTGNKIPKIEECAMYVLQDKINFYVNSEELADELLKEMEGKFYLDVCVYVGDKLVREKEIKFEY